MVVVLLFDDKCFSSQLSEIFSGQIKRRWLANYSPRLHTNCFLHLKIVIKDLFLLKSLLVSFREPFLSIS